MKKLTIGLAVLLSGIAATAQAAYPTGTSPCSVSVPSYSGGFTFGLTGLYWRATSPQRNVAVSFIPDDLFDAESFFEDDFSFAEFGDHHYHSINHEFEWGFKANVGYIFPCTGNDVNLTYTHYNDDHDKTINDFVLPSLLPVIALLNDPFAGPQITAEADAGTVTFAFPLSEFINSLSSFEDPEINLSHQFYAKSELKNHTWDLDFGQAINVGCNFNFRIFGGLRYSKVEHKLQTINNTGVALEFPELARLFIDIGPTFIVSSTVEGLQAGDVIGNSTVALFTEQDPDVILDLDFTESVLRKNRFEGLGPRIGIDMNYHFCGGFGLVGSLSTSLLVGRARNDLNQSVTLATELNSVVASVLNVGETTFFDFNANINTPSTTVDFSHSRPQETRVVPNIDAKLGIDYSYDFCNCSHTRLTVEAGYQVSHYFSAIDRLGWTDGLNLGLDSGCHNTVDVSFDGPYVSVQVAL